MAAGGVSTSGLVKGDHESGRPGAVPNSPTFHDRRLGPGHASGDDYDQAQRAVEARAVIRSRSFGEKSKSPAKSKNDDKTKGSSPAHANKHSSPSHVANTTNIGKTRDQKTPQKYHSVGRCLTLGCHLCFNEYKHLLKVIRCFPNSHHVREEVTHLMRAIKLEAGLPFEEPKITESTNVRMNKATRLRADALRAAIETKKKSQCKTPIRNVKTLVPRIIIPSTTAMPSGRTNVTGATIRTGSNVSLRSATPSVSATVPVKLNRTQQMRADAVQRKSAAQRAEYEILTGRHSPCNRAPKSFGRNKNDELVENLQRARSSIPSYATAHLKATPLKKRTSSKKIIGAKSETVNVLKTAGPWSTTTDQWEETDEDSSVSSYSNEDSSVSTYSETEEESVVCTPEVCTPVVCTPEVCTPEVPEVCTPEVPVVCTPEVCTPEVPVVCTPEVCTVPVESSTPPQNVSRYSVIEDLERSSDLAVRMDADDSEEQNSGSGSKPSLYHRFVSNMGSIWQYFSPKRAENDDDYGTPV